MSTIIVAGRLVSPTCIELAHPISLSDAEIEVEIRPSLRKRRLATLSLLEVLAQSPARGRTKEEVDAQIREERDSWERENRIS